MGLDVARIRADFPVLAELVGGRPITYLDSANTSQKPRAVIDAMADFMSTGYAPINRSAYELASRATDRYERARASVARGAVLRLAWNRTSTSPMTPITMRRIGQ